MREEEQEFIDHLKEMLQKHEEPYSDGAWERYAAIGKVLPSKPKPYKWLAAAASIILILGAGLWLYFDASNKSTTEKYSQQKESKLQMPDSATESPNVVKDVNYIAVNKEKLIIPKNISKNHAYNPYLIRQKNTSTSVPITVMAAPENYNLRSYMPLKIDTNHLLQQENHEITQDKTAIVINDTHKESVTNENDFFSGSNFFDEEDNYNTKKWNLAAQVASSFGNYNKVNMSYGLDIGYALNDRISLHSGTSFTQINTALEMPNTKMSSASSVSSNHKHTIMDKATAYAAERTPQNNLASSELRLSGIEVPLEMRYHFSKNLYGNMGVSAMALVENKQKNTYLSETNKPVAYSISKETSTADVIQKTQETIPGNNVVDNKFLQFFNVSLGYRQPLNSKRNINVEPFLKVPINKSNQVPLTNAGIRVGIDL